MRAEKVMLGSGNPRIREDNLVDNDSGHALIFAALWSPSVLLRQVFGASVLGLLFVPLTSGDVREQLV